MYRRLLAVVLCVTLTSPRLALACSGDLSVVEGPSSLQTEVANLAAANDAVQNSENAKALDLIKAVLAAPVFAELPSAQQHAAYVLGGWAYRAAGDPKTALELLKKSSVMPEATGADWHARFTAAYLSGDKDDATESLRIIARRWPDSLSSIKDEIISRLAYDAWRLPDGQRRQTDLLAALFDANWTFNGPFFDASPLWLDLARLLIAARDIRRAAAVAQAVREPYAVAEMKIDKIFDPITQASPARFDPQLAMTAYIAELRAKVAAHPDSLSGVNRLAMYLMSARRDEEAIKLCDEALAKALPGDGSKSSYADAETEVIWTLDTRSRALARLGRYDEAVAALQRAARRPEGGRINVSQTINLAELYARMGRPKDALAAVADVSPRNVSPYGLVAAEEAKAMAYAQTGDAPALARSIALGWAHLQDAPGVLEAMLVSADDIDGAAKLYVDRLADPSMRDAALSELQEWRRGAVGSAFDRSLYDRTAAIRARPDVKAAVDKVGRIESFDFYQGPG